MGKNKVVVLIILIVSILYLSFVGFIFLRYFPDIVERFSTSMVDDREVLLDTKDTSEYDESKPRISFDGLAHIEPSDDKGYLTVIYTDFDSKEEVPIYRSSEVNDIAQNYGSKYLVIGEFESLRVLDKVSGDIKEIEFAQIDKLKPYTSEFIQSSISSDGKYFIFSLRYFDLSVVDENFDVVKSGLYVYDFENRETKEIFVVNGEFSPLDYTWNVDSSSVYVNCPLSICSDFEGLNGILRVDISSFEYVQVEKSSTSPLVEDNRVCVFDCKYILGSYFDEFKAKIYVEKKGVKKDIEDENSDLIQKIYSVSKDNRYGVYQKLKDYAFDDIPYFSIMVLDIESMKSVELVEGSENMFIEDIYWLNDKEIAYGVKNMDENGINESIFNWYVVEIQL